MAFSTFYGRYSGLMKSYVSVSYKLCRNMSSSSSEVLVQSIGNKGVITLNRPKALNALNLQMIREIYPVLKRWESEKCLVIVKGTGEKAFCAGGDVRAITEAGLKNDRSLGEQFFREEYTLNCLIGTYHIPYVALLNGITMGGGVGISVHGKYRVATEKTVFAMPETAIGLFPDVGGSYFLPRLGGKLGLYLALTGERLKGLDVLKAGIATHYCESSQLNDLEKALLEESSTQSSVEQILNKFSNSSQKEHVFSLGSYIKQIDQCFSAPTVEEIIKRLDKDGSEWAKRTISVLGKFSPTSLKIVLKQLEEGATKSLQDCLVMEYRLACHCLEARDFFEGVRALLIDKDQNPKWNPSTLEEVTQERVDKFFSPLSPEKELSLTLNGSKSKM